MFAWNKNRLVTFKQNYFPFHWVRITVLRDILYYWRHHVQKVQTVLTFDSFQSVCIVSFSLAFSLVSDALNAPSLSRFYRGIENISQFCTFCHRIACNSSCCVFWCQELSLYFPKLFLRQLLFLIISRLNHALFLMACTIIFILLQET